MKSIQKKKSASKNSKLTKMEAFDSKQLIEITGGGTRGSFAIAGRDSR